jgi:hypothetical protein
MIWYSSHGYKTITPINGQEDCATSLCLQQGGSLNQHLGLCPPNCCVFVSLQVAHSAVFSAEYYCDAGNAGWRDNEALRKHVRLRGRAAHM